MIHKILKVLLVLVVALLGYGLAGSSAYSISVGRQLPVPHASILPFVASAKMWTEWWPWQDLPLNKKFTVLEDKKLQWLGRPTPGTLRLTETAISRIAFTFRLVGNREEGRGTLQIMPNSSGTSVLLEVSGEVEMPILGPYLAYLYPSMHGGKLSYALLTLGTLAQNSDVNVSYDRQGEELSVSE